MSPWDELNYFDSPLQTNFTSMSGTNTAPTLIAKFNARRVGIIFATFPGAGTTTVWVGIKKPMGAAEGLGIVSSYSPIFLTQKDWGSLVQVEWYGWSAGFVGAGFTVIEAVMKGTGYLLPEQ